MFIKYKGIIIRTIFVSAVQPVYKSSLQKLFYLYVNMRLYRCLINVYKLIYLQWTFSGQALKPEAASFFASFVDGLKKFYVTRVKGFEPYKIAVATLVFEGNAEEVAAQEKRVYEIASNYGYDTSPCKTHICL